MAKSAVIIKAKRTPIGKEKGAFRELEPHQLVSPLLGFLGSGIEHQIDDILLGNVVGPGGNVARLSALEAGLPISTTGLTIDRQCSAGLEAIRIACYLIQGGAGTCYIAGGVESASTSPFKKRARFSPDQIGDPDMGIAAENVAQKYHISRDMQDEYALLSYQRSWEAYQKGRFDEEILPLQGIAIDEELQKQRNIEKIIKRAKPIFLKEKGTVTAANSCGIHDGASAVVVMEEQLAITLGHQPVLRFVDSQVSGVHPKYPGIAPVEAISQLLRRNQLTIHDIHQIEINEAFSSKIVACSQELDIPYEKLNIHGGAIAMGHPYGASGAILVTRLFHEALPKKEKHYVLASIGSGGGIGLAVLFERGN